MVPELVEFESYIISEADAQALINTSNLTSFFTKEATYYTEVKSENIQVSLVHHPASARWFIVKSTVPIEPGRFAFEVETNLLSVDPHSPTVH